MTTDRDAAAGVDRPILTDAGPSSFSLPLRLTVLLVIAQASFSGARLAVTLSAVTGGASPFAVGVLLSLLTLVPSLVSIRVGRWADRVGFVTPTLLGLCVLAGAEVLACWNRSLPVLALVSVLVGTGYTVAHVAVNNAIAQAAGPEGRVGAFGRLAMGYSLSALTGPLLVGLTIDHASFSSSFALMAALPLVSALMVRRIASQVGRTACGQRPHRPPAAGLLQHRPLRKVLVTSAIVSVGWDLFTFVVPVHAAGLGLSATAIGVVVGAFGAGSFGARLALPSLTRHWGEWKVLRAVLALSALGYAAFPLGSHFAALLLLSFLLGLVLGCGQPVVMSLVIKAAPEGQTGEAVGLRTALTSVIQSVLPLAFGGFGAALGLLPLFWAAATVLASGAGYVWRGSRGA